MLPDQCRALRSARSKWTQRPQLPHLQYVGKCARHCPPPHRRRHRGRRDKLQMASCCSARGQRTSVHGAPEPKAPEMDSLRPLFRGAPPSPIGSTQPAHFQSRLTSHNKECRDGEEAQHQPAAQARLSGSCSALTFEAMGTLLKEQMLTDVQAHEHGNYTSG